jgi:hypothetical protein
MEGNYNTRSVKPLYTGKPERCTDNTHFQLTPFLDAFTELHKVTQIAIFLASGGRFAGAIYHKNSCLRHRTWHRSVPSYRQEIGLDRAKVTPVGTLFERSKEEHRVLRTTNARAQVPSLREQA